MTLQLKLFGAPRLERDGAAVAGRAVQRRRLAILILLSRAPRRTLTRERILGYLWPETAPDAARRLLTESIYVLRRELGEDVLNSIGDDLTLSSQVVSDVDEFLSSAAGNRRDLVIDLHVSPLLDGWFVGDAPDFEQWVESERGRTTALWLKAIDESARAREAVNDSHGAIDLWQRLLRADPYNSTAVVHCARARVAIGDRAGAMTLIQAHEARLREDLDADLDTELFDLAADIKDGRLQPSPRTPVEGRARSEAPARRDPADSLSDTTPSADTVQSLPTTATPLTGIAQPTFVLLKRPVLLGLGAVVGLAMLLSLAASQRLLRAEVTPASRAGLDPLRIAVLDFESPAGDSSKQYLADGITEGLVRELSSIPQITVLSRDAVARFRAGPIPADSAGRILQAGTVIRANVQQAGARLRVLARIIDAASARQLATIQVDAGAGELFALTDSLSFQIAAALRQHLGGDLRVSGVRRRVYGGQRNDRALELLFRSQRARKSVAATWNRNSPDMAALSLARARLESADSMLAEAEAIDPAFAQVSIERGWVAVLAGKLESGTARVVALSPALGYAERARAALRQAVTMDSASLADVLYLLGRARLQTAVAVQTFRSESPLLRAGEANLDSAVTIDSTLAGAWAHLSEARRLRGDFAGARLAAEHALKADPFLEDAGDVVFSGWIASLELGDANSADGWCRRGYALQPTDWRFTECALTNLRLDAVGLSKLRPNADSAWALVRTLERMDSDAHARAAGRPYSPVFRRLTAAAISAATGDTATARRVLAQERARVRSDPELSTDLLYDAAFVHLTLRELDAARTSLRAYVRARPDFREYVERDMTLRGVRPI